MAGPVSRRTAMRPHITKNGQRSCSRHACAAARTAALVIICSLPAARPAHAQVSNLTTSPVAALATVVVDGSSVYAQPRLFAAYRDQLGRPASRDGARAIASALLAMYEQDGYVRPEVEVDDSAGGRGILRLQVHEAQVTRVIFSGNSGRYRRALEEIAAQLEAARPLRKDDLPDALRAMRRISGLTISVNTRRDAEMRNAFELLVRAEFSAVEGLVRMNNRGTSQVGPEFMLGQLFLNGLWGRDQKLGLIFAAASDPSEYLGEGLYFDAALAPDGTRGSALLFRSHSAPNERPVNYSDAYLRDHVSFRVSHPLRQDADFALTLGAALEADDLLITEAGTELRDERLRIIETGLRAGWRGAAGFQYSGNLQLRKGLNAFGAGLQALDLADDPRSSDFLLAQLAGSVYRRFATDWSLRFDGFAQFSADVLPDGERFKIGGDRLGRGFEVAEIAGDRGLGGKLELRRDLSGSDGSLGRLSAYGFYDIGAAWKHDLPGRESAATAGTGLAISGATLSGYLEVAAPLTGADVEGKHQASIFAELSYRF
jgi:hemolysin activation/secretion protein